MSSHGPRRPLSWARIALICLALAAHGPAPVHAQPAELPRLGDAGGDQLSPIAERRLGESIMREIRRARALLDDPELVDYLNRLAGRLAAQPSAAGFSFELFAVEDRSINAFALPGGYIGVHTGLVASSNAESELASVLAHELGHVTQRHIARMLATQQQSSSVLVASLVAALLAARSNPQAAAGLVSLGSTLQMQQMLGHSRDAEREADRVGVEMLQQSGFDPQGMVDFFGRLQAASRLSESALPAYLRTHPLTGERMSDIQNRVMGLRYRQHADSLEFAMLRARYRVLADRSTDGLNRASQLMERAIEDGAVSAMVGRYALAAGALAAGETSRARTLIGQARAASAGPPHPYLEQLAALIELEAGEPRAALAIADRAIAQSGPTRALSRVRVRALSEQKHWQAAVEAAAQALDSARNDTELWALLARAQAARGDQAAAHVAMAELHTINGAWAAAIEQLQAAQRSRQLDFYDSSRLDARLRELRALFFQEREDRRSGR
jgi:predicted Zn-dependent protease